MRWWEARERSLYNEPKYTGHQPTNNSIETRIDAALVPAWVWISTTPGHLGKSVRVDISAVEHWFEESSEFYADLHFKWLAAAQRVGMFNSVQFIFMLSKFIRLFGWPLK